MSTKEEIREQEMKWGDIFFSNGVFEGILLAILYLAGIFFLGGSIYLIIQMIVGE